MGQTGGGWENLGALPFREKLWFFRFFWLFPTFFKGFVNRALVFFWFFWFFPMVLNGFLNIALVFFVFLVFSNGFCKLYWTAQKFYQNLEILFSFLGFFGVGKDALRLS